MPTEGGSDEDSGDEAGATASKSRGAASQGAPGDLPPSDSDEYTSSDEEKEQVCEQYNMLSNA